MKCENKKNSTPRNNVQFSASEHRNSSLKKDQKVCPFPVNVSVVYLIKWGYLGKI